MPSTSQSHRPAPSRFPTASPTNEAASLPTVYLPSWTILVRKAALKSWETALILSASAGVGTAAVQVAKHVIGATVIATTSTDEKAAMAAEIGADHVINYTFGGHSRAREGDHRRARRGRRIGPCRRRVLACRNRIARRGRAIRHLRRHHRLQGRAPDGDDVHPISDRLWSLHGPQGRDAPDRGNGRAPT